MEFRPQPPLLRKQKFCNAHHFFSEDFIKFIKEVLKRASTPSFVKSMFLVHSVGMQNEEDFKSYAADVQSENIEIEVAVKFSKIVKSPAYLCLIGVYDIKSTLYDALRCIVEFSQSRPSNLEDEYQKRFVFQTMDALSRITDSSMIPEISFPEIFVPASVAFAYVLMKWYKKYLAYKQISIILKHLPRLFSANPRQAFAAVYSELSTFELSKNNNGAASHMLLEYMAFMALKQRMDLLLLDQFLSPHETVLQFITHTCVPLVAIEIFRIKTKIFSSGTSIHSPEVQYLSSAEKALLDSYPFDPSWIPALKPYPGQKALANRLSLESKVQQVVVDNIFVEEKDTSQSTTLKPQVLLSAAKFKIHKIFATEWPIYSMGFISSSSPNLLLTTSRQVLEVETVSSYFRLSKEDEKQTSPSHGHNFISRFSLDRKKQSPSSISSSPSNSTRSSIMQSRSASPSYSHVFIRDCSPICHAALVDHEKFVLAEMNNGNCCLSIQSYKSDAPLAQKSLGESRANRLALDNSNSRVAVALDNGTATIFDTMNLIPLRDYKAYSRYASAAKFLWRSSLLVTAGSNPGHVGNVAIWDSLCPSNEIPVRAYNVHEGGSTCALFLSPYIFSAGRHGEICQVDTRHWGVVNVKEGFNSAVTSLGLSGNILYAGGADGGLRGWDISGGKFVDVAAIKHLHYVRRQIPGSTEKNFFSHFGITQIMACESYVLTCGSDGVVKVLH